MRQWPQSGERIGEVEAHFVGLRLGVGRRQVCGDTIVVEWSTDYGDGRVYRNVSIAELHDGKAYRVTDYWGEPFTPPPWRETLAGRLDMPPDGVWPAVEATAEQEPVEAAAELSPATAPEQEPVPVETVPGRNFSQFRCMAPLKTRVRRATPVAVLSRAHVWLAQAFDVDGTQHFPSSAPVAESACSSTVAAACDFTRICTLATPPSV